MQAHGYSQSAFNRQSVLRCILFLMGGNTPLKSLYLRACLLDVLMSFLPAEVDKIELSTQEGTEQNRLLVYQHEQHEFNRFEICQKEFVPVLLELYRDVERTGHAAQYYDKFKFRVQISKILKFLFQFKPHLDNLHASWNRSPEMFVGFLNMLINDLIYSLDHGLDGIAEVRELEENTSSNLSESEQEQKTNEIGEKRDLIKYYMLLAYESLDLLYYISVQIQKPFFHEHILPRMATLVSVYLDRLAGRAAQLKIGNMEQYNFKPRFLLTTIVKMVLILSVNEEFLRALVGDDALFRAEYYEKAVRFLRKHNLLPSREVDKFEILLQELIAKADERRNIEYINVTMFLLLLLYGK
ncbi:ubiquitin conjugation factor E4 B [Reticulomyxa filosa]|uniref:Ubiquitin conjugation factor E4 B n=1 Tax=Reticulomyxa filosa TaxID=46433 RepID=X6NNH5_RETFI|nr:ubiquitin conjugation factor E4 B [Reticulomyxa filosa]|eukprot:ETO27546.1 ubiquitin conjugation factor E4 B [Reticulomyxa filosa]